MSKMLDSMSWQQDGISIISLGALATGSLLILWYMSYRQTNEASWDSSAPLKRPPTLPYYIPFVKHLIQFLLDGSSLISKAAGYCGSAVPVAIELPGFSTYIVSGPEAIAAFFKNTRDLSTTSRGVTVIQNAFGCPKHLAHHFEPGYSSEGIPNEIEQAIHRGVQTGLSGPQLDVLANRFQISLLDKIRESQHEIGDDWVHVPDLTSFVQKYVIEAAMCTFFGPYMISLNPTVVDDFIHFNGYIRFLFMGMPRWLIPGAYKSRDKMQESIKRWYRHANENCDLANLDDVDWEPYYGSRFIRERQGLLGKRGVVDETARAAENFANLWASNANAVPATIWFMMEILRDSDLQTEARQRIMESRLSSNEVKDGEGVTYDVEKLCSDPLLQSVYAETLRLRVAALIVREAAHRSFSFMGWQIRRNEVLTVSSYTEAMNKDIWSTGNSFDSYPLDKFWARRFIVDPSDPRSGPVRNPKPRKPANGEPYFSTAGLEGTWIPYGGGRSLCPGRHFAKREIMSTAAAFLSAYEIQLGFDHVPAADMSQFGFGTMPPKGKLPCRIRRRQQ